MAKDYIFRQETFIPKPLDEVFAFFSKAENLEIVTPPNLRFKILTPQPIKMQQGALIDYQIQLLGIPFKWHTEITIWDPPFRFQDTQLKGPYRKWQHTHSFQKVQGGTQMTDQVVYQLLFSAVGNLANLLFVRNQIVSIFEYRKKQMGTLFRD